jgi:hypothetical protein
LDLSIPVNHRIQEDSTELKDGILTIILEPKEDSVKKLSIL